MTLESVINTYDGSQSIDDASSEKIVITMNKDEKTTYEIFTDDVKALEGCIKTVKEKNTEKLEIFTNVSMLGNGTLYVDTTVLKNNKIETVDVSKAVKLYELTEDEMLEIMTKIEESPLYELISMFDFEEGEDDCWEDDDSYDDDFGYGSNTYNGFLSIDTSINIKEEFLMLSPSVFEDYSYGEYEYSYEYKSEQSVFDTCSVSLNSPLGYVPSDNLINQMFGYYVDDEATSIISTTINGISWQWFLYENSFCKTYYYVTDKDNKVYLLKYKIDEDVDSKCETYRQQILNSITKK